MLLGQLRKSDVISASGSLEQRIRNRNAPRTRLSLLAEFLFSQEFFGTFQHLFYGDMPRYFFLAWRRNAVSEKNLFCRSGAEVFYRNGVAPCIFIYL